MFNKGPIFHRTTDIKAWEAMVWEKGQRFHRTTTDILEECGSLHTVSSTIATMPSQWTRHILNNCAIKGWEAMLWEKSSQSHSTTNIWEALLSMNTEMVIHIKTLIWVFLAAVIFCAGLYSLSYMLEACFIGFKN